MKSIQFVTTCHDAKPWQIVTVWVVVLLTLFGSGACCPCRRLATSTADSARVEVRTRTEFRRDTVYIDVPRETVTQVTTDSSYLETAFAYSEARIYPDGRLFHSLHNIEQRRPVQVEKVIEYRDSLVYRDRTAVEVVEIERQLTAWQRFQLSGFWVLAVVVACAVAFHIKRRYAWNR